MVPKSWVKVECAGKDWLEGFMHRHPDLSLRKPMATSLGRATAFNRHNVGEFFSKLKNVIQKFKIQSQNIWNVDETALTTVQKPVSVVAPRGARSVGGISSGERGTLVTLALACSACGVAMPPFYIFPRKKFQQHFLAGLDADGAANPSGWMKAEQFGKFLNHFVKYARPTKKVPALLLLDNHESHLSISNLDYCKENGIVVLSFPPHTTNKLQPLDRSVFGPIKRYFNAACDTWMRLPQNAAKPIAIYDIPRIAVRPIESGASIANIKSGFAVTGIWPLDENVFTDIDFLPSDITDRNNAEGRAFSPTVRNEELVAETPEVSAAIEVSSSDISTPSSVDLNEIIEDVRPYPKAPPRKQMKRGRKRKCAVLTDPSEMELLREEQQAVNAKKAKQITSEITAAEKKIEREKLKKAKKDVRVAKQLEKAARKAERRSADAEAQSATVGTRRGRPRKAVLYHISDSNDEDDE